MKIVLVFIFLVTLKSSVAQAPLSLMEGQLKKLILPGSLNELPSGNKNYIGLYWRSEIHRSIFDNGFHYKATKAASNTMNQFNYFSNTQMLFNANQIYLNTKIELTHEQLVLNNISMVLGNLFDTFFQEYSISNKIIY